MIDLKDKVSEEEYKKICGQDKNKNFGLKDSGKRQEFSTGAVRDGGENRGMPHLFPTHALIRLSQVFEKGAKKYSKNNWRKGIPLSKYLDSAFRHWCGVLDGDKSEDHATQCMWNMACFIETVHMIESGKIPKEVDDIGYTDGAV